MRARVWMPLATVGLFAAIQLVRPAQTNPPVAAELATPPAVHSVLRKACYDCHSNETTWPWYSYVAPASWLLARDVNEGRRELNFSTWGELSAAHKIKKLRKVVEEVREGEMPMAMYELLHTEARLSDVEREAIEQWASTAARASGPASP